MESIAKLIFEAQSKLSPEQREKNRLRRLQEAKKENEETFRKLATTQGIQNRNNPDNFTK